MIRLRENYKIYIWSIVAVSAFYILFVWFKYALSGEQGRVEKFILQGKRAVESKDILACANMISLSYNDKYGNDRQSLIYVAKEVFGYYKRILVSIESMDIKFDDSRTRAYVRIAALAIGWSQQNNAEKILEGQKGRFRIKLTKEEGKWHLSEVESFEPMTIMGQNIS